MSYSNETTTNAADFTTETETITDTTIDGQSAGNSTNTGSSSSLGNGGFIAIVCVAVVCAVVAVVGIVFMIRRCVKTDTSRPESADSYADETLKAVPFVVSASAPMSTAPMFKPRKEPSIHRKTRGFDDGDRTNHIIHVSSKANLLEKLHYQRRNSAVPRVG